MPDTTTYTRCMPANPKPMKIQVYAWYMQRPFRFNLAISTAKNLACVGHKSWYKSYEFLRKFQILVYIWHISPRTTQCEHRWEIFANGTLAGVW